MNKIWTLIIVLANLIVIPLILLNVVGEITSLLITLLILMIYFRTLYVQRKNKEYIENLQYAVYKNKDRISTLEKAQKKQSVK